MGKGIGPPLSGMGGGALLLTSRQGREAPTGSG